jgi:hypothetical protein
MPRPDPKDVICTGCGRSAAHPDIAIEYEVADDTVFGDGTYANGKFVCNACYSHLVPLGLDVGKPEVIQARAAGHCR